MSLLRNLPSAIVLRCSLLTAEQAYEIGGEMPAVLGATTAHTMFKGVHSPKAEIGFLIIYCDCAASPLRMDVATTGILQLDRRTSRMYSITVDFPIAIKQGTPPRQIS